MRRAPGDTPRAFSHSIWPGVFTCTVRVPSPLFVAIRGPAAWTTFARPEGCGSTLYRLGGGQLHLTSLPQAGHLAASFREAARSAGELTASVSSLGVSA